MTYSQGPYRQPFSEQLKKAKSRQKVELLLLAFASWIGFISFLVYCSLEIMFMV